ncbi:VWA-like domain-containing protein [Flavobacterium sp.]|uniref:vWA domain-containing protein n=1 Tax=Flavobacterium sp. TaxID=239 RepID=UPI00262CA876|nr:VWA-like domain-containing protein [Flavobacterium sp.]
MKTVRSEDRVTQSILDRVVAQKKRLLVLYPYFGALSTMLPVIADPSCETAWVDGVQIGINPTWINQYQDIMIMGLLAHEIAHVSHGHHFGSVGRNRDTWNEACDLAINPILKDEGFVLPDGFLIDEKYFGWSAEAIYFDLMQEEKSESNQNQKSHSNSSSSQNSDGNGSNSADAGNESQGDQNPGDNQGLCQNDESKPITGNQPGNHGDESDSESDRTNENRGNGKSERPMGNSSTSAGEIRFNPDANKQKNLENIRSAAQFAHGVGKLSSGLKRSIAEGLAPEIDYRSLLANFLEERRRNDYSWARPNPRYSHYAYLPSLEEKRIPLIYFVVDTSGSVSEYDLSCAQAVLKQMMAQVKPEKVIAICADCEVQSIQEFDEYSDIKLDGKGDGGTDFRPVFDFVEKEDPPAGLIYITDLEGEFPRNEPDYPVLWLSTNRLKMAPFGQTVFLDHRTENL